MIVFNCCHFSDFTFNDSVSLSGRGGAGLKSSMFLKTRYTEG